MRRLRNRLVQRLVAAALLVGLGAAWAPGAEAASGQADAVALQAALDAAVAAPTLDAASTAFAAAYVAHGGLADEAPALFDALVSQGFGAPDPLDEAFVPGRLVAPTPAHRGAAALAPETARDAPTEARGATAATIEAQAQPSPRRSPCAPRAP